MLFVVQVCEICYWAGLNTVLVKGRNEDLVFITHILFAEIWYSNNWCSFHVCLRHLSVPYIDLSDCKSILTKIQALTSWKSRASKIPTFCSRTISTYRHTIKFASEDKILILQKCKICIFYHKKVKRCWAGRAGKQRPLKQYYTTLLCAILYHEISP